MKLLTDTEVRTLAAVAQLDGLTLDFTQSNVYAVYIVCPTRRVGFTELEDALHFLAGYHEARKEASNGL